MNVPRDDIGSSESYERPGVAPRQCAAQGVDAKAEIRSFTICSTLVDRRKAVYPKSSAVKVHIHNTKMTDEGTHRRRK